MIAWRPGPAEYFYVKLFAEFLINFLVHHSGQSILDICINSGEKNLRWDSDISIIYLCV